MFTGIITDIGKVKFIEKNEGLKLTISTRYDMDTVDIGASIACSGVCLTVVEKGVDWFLADVSCETISRTNVGDWQVGSEINLERPLKVGDELGGHIISGHVDGLAEVVSIEPIDESYKITFKVPDNLKQFIAAKGSVALNGISLTVNDVGDDEFNVNIIPHTWKETNFSRLKDGFKVNLEIDVLARYVARMNEVGV